MKRAMKNLAGLPRWHCAVCSRSIMSDPSQPNGLKPTRLLHPQGFSRQEYWSGLPCPLNLPANAEDIRYMGSIPGLGRSPGEGQGNSLPVFLVAQLCLFATPWTVAHQATGPLSMAFPRQESWSGLSFPSPGGLPEPGMEPGSPALPADSLSTQPSGKPRNVGIPRHSLCLKDQQVLGGKVNKKYHPIMGTTEEKLRNESFKTT